MEQVIRAGLEALGLTGRVPEHAPAALAEYGRLLLEKNQVMNLTAIRDPLGVAQLHMLDCAALLGCTEWENRRLVDVGTGAGFPGLVLKILVPSLEVTLLDSLNKRLDWLEEVIAALHLTGVRTVHARAEELALEHGYRECFDIAASRAVADLRLLGELCLPYVKVGGQMLAMKSVDSTGELSAAAAGLHLLGGKVESPYDYEVPGAGVVHRVIPIRKLSPTPKGYPRRWAKMQKAPL